MYAKKIDLALPTGRTYYRTFAGSCCSFLVVLLTLGFTLLAVNEMLDENSFVLQTAIVKNWYEPTDELPFSSQTGDHDGSLQFAFGIVNMEASRGFAFRKTIVEPLPASVGEI